MPDVVIRPAKAEDHAAFARLMPQLGVDDPVPSPERWATNMVPGAYVAELDGDVVGYVYGQVLAQEGYVRHVVVDASARGHGIGRKLMLRFAEHVRKHGLSRWQLNVKPENVPAIDLYRSLGMVRRYASRTVRFDWTVVESLPDADARIEALGKADDPAFEAVLGMSPGLIDAARTRQPTVTLAAWRGDSPAGVAVFAPEFPGAFPFRVADPDVAGPLARALRPHARHPWTQFVFEDDPVTAERFTSRGGRVHLDIDHYAGPLP